jgi:hypothetical protein
VITCIIKVEIGICNGVCGGRVAGGGGRGVCVCSGQRYTSGMFRSFAVHMSFMILQSSN